MLRLFAVVILSLAGTSQVAACPAERADFPRYTFGVVPQFPAEQLYRDWMPVLDLIGSEIEVCFSLIIETSIPNFERALNTGAYDFAFANPFHAVIANEKIGYLPIIVDRERLLNGILIVGLDSEIASLNDLDGKRVVFPAPNAFGASLLVRQDLRASDIDVEIEFVGTHSNVYRQVALGIADAGGGVNNTLIRENENLQAQLRVLHETKSYPAHPIVVHPDVPEEIAAAFQTVMLNMVQQPNTERLLEAIQVPNPRLANFQVDYAPIVDLNLKELIVD